MTVDETGVDELGKNHYSFPLQSFTPKIWATQLAGDYLDSYVVVSVQNIQSAPEPITAFTQATHKWFRGIPAHNPIYSKTSV